MVPQTEERSSKKGSRGHTLVHSRNNCLLLHNLRSRNLLYQRAQLPRRRLIKWSVEYKWAPEDTDENEEVLHCCDYEENVWRDNHCEGFSIEEMAMRNVPLYRKTLFFIAGIQ